jgi:predicted PolB exonuclease-like 3'-5' exonuclease
MYSKEQLSKILFLDIETARSTKAYNELSEGMQKMWELKSQNIEPKDGSLSPEEKYYEKAAIYAEFGRVICISCGFIYEKDGEMFFKVKSFFGKDEKKILENFKNFLDPNTGRVDRDGNIFGEKKFFHYLAAHNGKEFDIPYMGRRYLVHQLALPIMLNIRGKKPWEVPHLLDTMELWKFGDGKNFTKLELLCNLFGIPTPKDDIDGSQVGEVFWEEENYERIAVYCEKDVVATAQLMLKYNFYPLIPENNIQYAERNVIV